MSEQPHRLFYKGQDYDFIIFVENIKWVENYRKGDTSIPLIDMVSIYKIFTNRQRGVEGVLDEASKAELFNEFGTVDKDEIIKKILKEGGDKSTTTFLGGYDSHNDSKGAGNTGN